MHICRDVLDGNFDFSLFGSNNYVFDRFYNNNKQDK